MPACKDITYVLDKLSWMRAERIWPNGQRYTWTDAKHDERVPVRPIAKTAPEAEQQIFVDREGIDVADPASFEVAGAGMMHGVGAAPEVIGRQRHHANHPTHPIVRQAMAEKRTMAAIVLNHE